MEIPESPLVKRITMRAIVEQIFQVLNLEKGLGYTVKSLALYPGKAIRGYLFEDRQRHIKPFQFLLLAVAIATFISVSVLPKPDDLLAQAQASPQWALLSKDLQVAYSWITLHMHQYFNVLYLIGLPFTALASYLVFRSAKLNYAEHLVTNSFIVGFQTIFYIFLIPFLVRNSWLGSLQIILVFFYNIYAFKLVFEIGWIECTIKVIGVFLLAQVMLAIFYGLVLGGFVLIY